MSESFDTYEVGGKAVKERTDYGKQGAHQMNTSDDKVESTSKGEAVRAGGSSGQNNGPTGSKRDYGKSGRSGSKDVHKTDWNPIEGKASTYGICGV